MTHTEFETAVNEQLQYWAEQRGWYYAMRYRKTNTSGATRFIGVEGNYFVTTFWKIKTGKYTGPTYPIGIVFAGENWGGPAYEIEARQTREYDDLQSASIMKLIQSLKGENSPFTQRVRSRSEEANNELITIHSPKKPYETLEELFQHLEADLQQLVPYVDAEIAAIKSNQPDFQARRYTSDDTEKLEKRYQKRLATHQQITTENKELVSQEEWTELLQNEVVVKPEDLRMLLAFYHSPNYENNAFRVDALLRSVPEEQGENIRVNNQHYHLARRIIEELNIEEEELEQRDDETYRSSSVLFTIRRDNGRIPLRLQPNLIAALTDLDLPLQITPTTPAPTTAPPPKNQLLYGPPGTGKTHATLTKAVNLAQPGHQATTRAEYRKLYQNLVAEGKITFVTFHQSLSYEDFVEGLKPLLNDELADGEVRYQIQPGILREVVSEAIYSYVARGRSQQQTTTPEFIAVWNAYLAEVRNQLEFRQPVTLKMKNGNEAEIVDISSQNNLRVKHVNGDHIYSVSSARQAKLNEAFPKLEDLDGNLYTAFNEVIGGSNASLQWAVLNAIQEFAATMTASQREESQRTLSRSDRRELARNLKRIDFSPTDVDRHVLIIDEINRGNVSAILGELITLLEPDKRLGGPEALTVTLPYSRDEFGIPPNLYLIGTMNTADRSVESLDAALRRRFVFEEIGPDPQVITNVAPNGGVVDVNGRPADLAVLLNLLNNRIATLRDEDHQLGHSYFLHIRDWQGLRTVFRDRILPLLREYFFANYGQLQLIVGNGFCVSSQTGGTTFAQADADEGLDTDGLRRFTFPEASSAAELAEQLTKLKYPWPT